MNVLVTGGTGYIGSHTCLELLLKDYNVIIIDNLSNSNKKVIDMIENLSNKKVEFYEFDLLDKVNLNKVFINHKISAVVHFAGLKSVNESVEDPLRYYENNLISSINLFETMKSNNVKKLIFSSSATVYGTPEVIPIKEYAPKSTTNPYGTTKLMIEKILQDISESDPEWEISILRYFNPIGAHDSGKIGENPKGIPNNLMPYIAQVASGELKELTIYGNDYNTIDGTGIRDYIHVVDLAKGHIKALEHNHSGIDDFNLGTGNGYSVLEVVKAFEFVTGKKINYTISKRRQGDVAICYADISKSSEILGWKSEKTLYDMCKDVWKWQMSDFYTHS